MKEIKIYKIINKDTQEVVYIGSTKRSIKQRGKEHKQNIMHPEKHKYIRDNSCEIRVIEYCDLADKRKREDFWINLWKPRFNRRFEIAKKRVNVNKQIEMKMADDKAKEIIKRLQK